MRHYVLTRSAFGPAWDLGANNRRFAITRAVTARLMARQTARDWTWIVLLDERDPNLKKRLALYRDSAPAFKPIVTRGPTERPAVGKYALRQRIAAADYRAPWREGIPTDEQVLTTRLDDDDGFAPDALERYQRAAAGIEKRTALMLPIGVWTYRNLFALVRHERNAMHTLVAPPGDGFCVYDYGHTTVHSIVPVVMVDAEPGWLWVRHLDTISLARQPGRWGAGPARVTPNIRALFPIDWPALQALR